MRAPEVTRRLAELAQSKISAEYNFEHFRTKHLIEGAKRIIQSSEVQYLIAWEYLGWVGRLRSMRDGLIQRRASDVLQFFSLYPERDTERRITRLPSQFVLSISP
jgi:hypothetical protein